MLVVGAHYNREYAKCRDLLPTADPTSFQIVGREIPTLVIFRLRQVEFAACKGRDRCCSGRRLLNVCLIDCGHEMK